MDRWLDAGSEPGALERQSLFPQATPCSLTSATPDGALRTRTARIESVGSNGAVMLIHLHGAELEREIIPNPRVTLMAWPADGAGLTVVQGLARMHSRVISGAERDLSLVEITIQRVECWPQHAERPMAAVGPAA